MNTLTHEQIKYLAERTTENSYGRILVPTRLIEKYRQFTGDYQSHNAVVRARIQDATIRYRP